ncbi:Hypothetical_protein [Hexamita inflata]|uniref:Hypothetical_protein n=1 Tax=Hexamita inflata TaxID=28002 RepID=A0AA86R6I1_9EUKA|nr:Hypothetical protein HINF_LOCUS54592 [Hexamita inflata]
MIVGPKVFCDLIIYLSFDFLFSISTSKCQQQNYKYQFQEKDNILKQIAVPATKAAYLNNPKNQKNQLYLSGSFCWKYSYNFNNFCKSKFLGTSNLEPYQNNLAPREAYVNYLNNLWKIQNLKFVFN